MESCGMNVIKYLLFVFNLIFAISGIGLIAAGAIIVGNSGDFQHFESDDNFVPSIILIVAGGIVFVVSFLGCVGAIKESYCMLISFAVCLVLIFIVELAIGITGAVNKNELSADKFSTSLSQYHTNEKEKEAWDKIQSKLMCCGVKGPNDWSGSVPASCCKETAEGNDTINAFCVASDPSKKYLSSIGCFDKVTLGVRNNSKALIGVGISIALIEIFGIILSCWLAAVIKRENSDAEK